MVDSVTSVIEEELNGAKGLLYYDSSNSSTGIAELTVTLPSASIRTWRRSMCRTG